MTARFLLWCVFRPFPVLGPSQFRMQNFRGPVRNTLPAACTGTWVLIQIWLWILVICFRTPGGFRGTFRTCAQTPSFHTWEHGGWGIVSIQCRSQNQKVANIVSTWAPSYTTPDFPSKETASSLSASFFFFLLCLIWNHLFRRHLWK